MLMRDTACLLILPLCSEHNTSGPPTPIQTSACLTPAPTTSSKNASSATRCQAMLHDAYNLAHMPYSHPCTLSLCSLLPQVVTCSWGHELSMLTLNLKWGCNACLSPYSYNPRLRCFECDFDLCNECAKMQVCGDV